MAASTPSQDDARVEAILELWFAQKFEGGEPDLEALCGDEPHLLPRVRDVLARQDELIGPGRSEQEHASAALRPLPVDHLGDYELKSRIASGGMGDVYLAREVTLDRMVALKVLRRELTDDPLRRLRFKREAQLTAALDHPNIVPIYGTGEDQGHVFLVMKLLPGTTLDRAQQTWEPRRIAAIGALVARALHDAHEVGIVHRDVKPGNVQVDGDDAWVLDFGLARGRVDLTLTTAGQAPGTLAYMPPEQLRGDGALDPRGDVYSLGATLYQCLAGHPPFDEDSPEALVRRALLHDPEPLRLEAADRDLNTIVMRALEKVPARRFPTALEFAADLERFAAGEPIVSRPPSTLTRAVKLCRRHRVAVGALAAAALVALVLGSLMWRDSIERAADLTRRFDVVSANLAAGAPAVAMRRLQELEDSPEGRSDSRFAALDRAVSATLVRDALLDRIQLDAAYREHTNLADAEFVAGMQDLPQELRSDPLTLVASAFQAWSGQDLEVARQRIHELGATGGFRRLVAAFLATLAGQDVSAALEGVQVGELAVADHVFTAVLLRVSDAPPQVVGKEIAAALGIGETHRRARLMLGIQHWIAGDSGRAAEVLTLLLDDDHPSVEVHCMIADLAIRLGQLDRAARHVELAQQALARARRPGNRRLELARIRVATSRGDLDTAAATLQAAREAFGDDEWFGMEEAAILLARGDRDRLPGLIARYAEEARVPWNRRRARCTQLDLDVEAFDGTLESAQRLLAQAEQLGRQAEARNDQLSAAQAWSAGVGIAHAVYGATSSADTEEVFLRMVKHTLVADDLNEIATYYGALHASNRMAPAMRDPAREMEYGEFAFQMRRRAVELARRGFRGQQQIDFLHRYAVFAAFLSAHANDAVVAKEMGGIASVLIRESDRDGNAVAGGLQELLEHARLRLDLEAWPEPMR